MDNRTPMFEIFSAILEYSREYQSVPEGREIFEYLIEEGYEPWEIAYAVSCLDALFYQHTKVALKVPSKNAIRIFNEEEISTLPNDVKDLLQLLRQKDEIKNSECEFVTKALMTLPSEEITVDNAKLLMLIRLIGQDAEITESTEEMLFSVFDDVDYYGANLRH